MHCMRRILRRVLAAGVRRLPLQLMMPRLLLLLGLRLRMRLLRGLLLWRQWLHALQQLFCHCRIQRRVWLAPRQPKLPLLRTRRQRWARASPLRRTYLLLLLR